MLRMMKMELVVFSHYLKQLSFTVAFMAICLSAGMGSMSAIPGTVFLMLMFSMSVSGSAYDEQNDWGSFRLAMPVSRRDVVLGRYAFGICISVVAALLACAVVAALTMLGEALPLPEFVADILAWEDGELEGALGAFVSCVCISLAMCSVTLPAYFKLGQTKATQWLPFIMLFISVVPFLAIAAIGGPLLEQVTGYIDTAGSTGGLTAIAVIAPCVALTAYVASAFISVRLYEGRDM